MPALTLTAIPDLPLVEPGDDLAAILIDGLARAGIAPAARDVLVVAQKVVSKAENRYFDLGAVTPSNRARDLALAVDKDPRLVEVILSESEAVVAHKPGVLVVAHRLGFVTAPTWAPRRARSAFCCCPRTRTPRPPRSRRASMRISRPSSR